VTRHPQRESAALRKRLRAAEHRLDLAASALRGLGRGDLADLLIDARDSDRLLDWRATMMLAREPEAAPDETP